MSAAEGENAGTRHIDLHADLARVVCCESPATEQNLFLASLKGVDGVVVVAGVVEVLVVDAPEPGVDGRDSGVVEVTGGSAPSPVVVEPAGASAPRAPPASGPPRPATVSPPPASADSTVRHLTWRQTAPRREPRLSRPLIGGLWKGWSSGGPLFMVDLWLVPQTHDRGARHRYSYR